MVAHGEIRPRFSENTLKIVNVMKLVLPRALLKHIQPEVRSSEHCWTAANVVFIVFATLFLFYHN